MKYLHYMRDHFYKDIPVGQAAAWLLQNFYHIKADSNDPEELLFKYRKLDKNPLEKVIQ
jgi:hypothetical protein